MVYEKHMPEKRTYADRREYLKRAVAKRRKAVRKRAIEYKGGKSVPFVVISDAKAHSNSIMPMVVRSSEFLKMDSLEVGNEFREKEKNAF